MQRLALTLFLAAPLALMGCERRHDRNNNTNENANNPTIRNNGSQGVHGGGVDHSTDRQRGVQQPNANELPSNPDEGGTGGINRNPSPVRDETGPAPHQGTPDRGTDQQNSTPGAQGDTPR